MKLRHFLVTSVLLVFSVGVYLSIDLIQHGTNRQFTFVFVTVLAEFVNTHDGRLPLSCDEFVAWHNRRQPQSPWKPSAIAELYEMPWGTTVTNISHDQPIVIILVNELKPLERTVNDNLRSKLRVFPMGHDLQQ